jgi:hypothetical protein
MVDSALGYQDHRWAQFSGTAASIGAGFLTGRVMEPVLARVAAPPEFQALPEAPQASPGAEPECPTCTDAAEAPVTNVETLKDGAEKFLVKKEGYSPDPRYANRAMDASTASTRMALNGDFEALAEQNGTTASTEHLDYLARCRRVIAQELEDPVSNQFGQRRYPDEGVAATPLGGKYPLEPALSNGPVVGEINGEPVQLTRVREFNGRPWWWHTDPGQFPAIDAHVEELYQQAMTEDLSPAELTSTVAEIHWWLAHEMPYVRGSAAITDMFTKSIFEARGMEVSPLTPGEPLDVVALNTKTPDQFIAEYPLMFEAPPQPRAGAQCRTCAASDEEAMIAGP